MRTSIMLSRLRTPLQRRSTSAWLSTASYNQLPHVSLSTSFSSYSDDVNKTPAANKTSPTGYPEEHVVPDGPFATADPLSSSLYESASELKPLFNDSRKPIYSSPSAISQILPYVKLGGRASVSGLVVTVFGASGFIGKFTASQFARVGSQVIVPYRGDGINVRDLKVAGELGQVVPLPIDLTDKESIRRCVSRSNVVINCLGTHYETSNYSYHDTHVKIPYRLAEICREVGVERFVHMSPVGANPNSASEYYKSHGLGEQVIRHFYPDATIVRSATAYGPGDNFISRISNLGYQLWRIPVANGGHQQHQLIHVDDLARAILAVTVRPESVGKIYELGGPNVYSFNEIVQIVSKASYNNWKTIALPDTIAKLYGHLLARPIYPRDPPFLTNPSYNKTMAGILDSVTNLARKVRFPHFFHSDLVPQAYVNLVPDPLLPGIRELGIEPRSFMSSIENTVYFMQNFSNAPPEFLHANHLRQQADVGTR